MVLWTNIEKYGLRGDRVVGLFIISPSAFTNLTVQNLSEAP